MTFERWVEFMTKTHGYQAWDGRLVKHYEVLRQLRGRLQAGARVLDIGAGQCEMREFFSDFRYLGTDTGVGDAGWDYTRLDVAANVLRLPFGAGVFDAAICLWVGEHVRDPLGMTLEAARVLKPGGWFLTFLPFVVHEHQAPHDYYRFTRFGVAALMEEAGLTEIEVVADSSTGFAVAYEGLKHLNTLAGADGLPPEWKQQLAGAQQVVIRLVEHFAQEREFPAQAPALSYLSWGRKPPDWRERPELSGRTRPAAPAAATTARRINVGCGNQKMPGWIGIDAVRTPAVDIVRDLRRGLPFEDSSIDEIYCDNVLEHIGPAEDFIFVLNEFYRVLKPGARATIIVPDGRSQAAWQDPTHQRAFVPRSALYWNQDLQWPKLYGITADFDVKVEAYGDPNAEAFLKFTCRAR